MVCCGPGLKGGEFGEPVRDPVPRINVGAKFVVAAVEVLNEGVPCADRFRRAQPLRPRIGRSRDFRRSLPDLAFHRRDSPVELADRLRTESFNQRRSHPASLTAVLARVDRAALVLTARPAAARQVAVHHGRGVEPAVPLGGERDAAPLARRRSSSVATVSTGNGVFVGKQTSGNTR